MSDAPSATAAPPPRHPQYNLKVLLGVMTLACVMVAATVQFQNALVLLIPAGLLSLLLVRNRWALAVVGLYAATLFVMIGPLVMLAFLDAPKSAQDLANGLVNIYGNWPFWIWFDVMVIGQAALLVLPVAKAEGRPVRRATVFKPLIAAGFMAGLLVFAAIVSIVEFLASDPFQDGAAQSGLAAGLAVWVGWTIVFYLASRRHPSHSIMASQCRLLLRGSALELLIAVPTHIVARSRDYCCAGFMTFLGLVFGISVMLFSFGPGLFFLFLIRWRQVRPQPRE
jgi:hypothetical protein